MIKQVNIFGEIDHFNEDGTKNTCEMCGKSMEIKADVCSTKCAEKWVEKYLIIEEKKKI